MKLKLSLFLVLSTFVLPTGLWARPVFGKHGLVTSGSELASNIGVKILKSGGSAADAAVATAFALAVCRPYYGSLGGGGFMITKFKGEIEALDHRERAPKASQEKMFVGKPNASITGALSVATPGNVRGLFELHKKHGKLPWARDLAPAIEMAKKGFVITEEFARLTHENYSNFNESAKKIFRFKERELAVGDLFKQPQLARALEVIQKSGADGFYKNQIAEDIVKTIKREGGILEGLDLELYKTFWRKPLHARVFGADVYTMPPPSSGGALLLEELKLSEALKIANDPPFGAEQYHVMAEIMSRAFFDRQYIADPQYSSVPADEFYRDEHVQKWISTINRAKKSSFDPKKFQLTSSSSSGHEGGNTTHYVVVDSQGNVVSATTTLNGNYGSGVATERYGIFLNNEMDDFTTVPGVPNLFGLVQGQANSVAPLKTPLSSMTPTLVEKDEKFFMALGAPGGPRIINAVYQVLFHALTTPFDLDELIQAPRVHHQSRPDKIFYDRSLSPDTREALEKKGHSLTEGMIARVYAIRAGPDGLLEGAFDSRMEGGVAGY